MVHGGVELKNTQIQALKIFNNQVSQVFVTIIVKYKHLLNFYIPHLQYVHNSETHSHKTGFPTSSSTV